MRRLLATAALGLACLLPDPAAAQEWQLRGEKDGIAIYTRAEADQELDSFRGVTRVEVGLRALVDLLTDVTAYPRWYAQTEKARALETQGLREGLVYTVTGAPWPVSDRDSVVRWRLTQQEDLSVHISLGAEPDGAPLEKGMVRVPRLEGSWHLRPLDAKRTEVRYELRLDPGGALPAWLARSWVVDLPRQTLEGLHREIAAHPELGSAARFEAIRQPAETSAGP